MTASLKVDRLWSRGFSFNNVPLYFRKAAKLSRSVDQISSTKPKHVCYVTKQFQETWLGSHYWSSVIHWVRTSWKVSHTDEKFMIVIRKQIFGIYYHRYWFKATLKINRFGVIELFSYLLAPIFSSKRSVRKKSSRIKMTRELLSVFSVSLLP